jgi:hypothetical protein
MLGMLSPIVFPLNSPTITSSTTSKTRNKIEIDYWRAIAMRIASSGETR